jgi:dihydroflavonol-4-reductase
VTLARFDGTVRLALGLVGVPQLVSADKAKRELGWTARPASESVLDTAESLIGHGVVRPRGADRKEHAVTARSRVPVRPGRG